MSFLTGLAAETETLADDLAERKLRGDGAAYAWANRKGMRLI